MPEGVAFMREWSTTMSQANRCLRQRLIRLTAAALVTSGIAASVVLFLYLAEGRRAAWRPVGVGPESAYSMASEALARAYAAGRLRDLADTSLVDLLSGLTSALIDRDAIAAQVGGSVRGDKYVVILWRSANASRRCDAIATAVLASATATMSKPELCELLDSLAGLDVSYVDTNVLPPSTRSAGPLQLRRIGTGHLRESGPLMVYPMDAEHVR